MTTYRIRYVHGPNDRLVLSDWEEVAAATIAEALAKKTPWPVEENMDANCAWAKNPGNSLYHIEAWEAEQASCPPAPSGAPYSG